MIVSKSIFALYLKIKFSINQSQLPKLLILNLSSYIITLNDIEKLSYFEIIRLFLFIYDGQSKYQFMFMILKRY